MRRRVPVVSLTVLTAFSLLVALPNGSTAASRGGLLGLQAWIGRGLSGGAQSILELAERGQTATTPHHWTPSAPAASTAGAAGVPNAPTVLESFEGPFDPLLSPSDSTGAVGPTRYITLVNSQVAFYDRTQSPPQLLNTGPMQALAGFPTEFPVFDPQIMWDPTTRRFYYMMDAIVSLIPSDYQIAWGYSLTAHPTTPSDWCHYLEDWDLYGTSGWFPDYPKLGDTRNFLLMGTNAFNDDGVSFRTDLDYIQKPPRGPVCQPPGALAVGSFTDLRNEDGSPALTPVPANQVDPMKVGVTVAEGDIYDNGPASFMTLFATKENGAGLDLFGPYALSVPTYDFPALAPQPGPTDTLDTLDGRFTQAVLAHDPTFNRKVLWTQHTVAGGAGAEVRWYEVGGMTSIGPPELLQSGAVSDSSLYVFNGAISSDRVVNGATRAFGDGVVIGFNTSSTAAFPAIQMVSKIGLGAQSGFVLVKQSTTADNDFTCFDDRPGCRWGDYSAASPDPAADSSGAHGVVWATNQWNRVSNPNISDWGSWNWAAAP